MSQSTNMHSFRYLYFHFRITKTYLLRFSRLFNTDDARYGCHWISTFKIILLLVQNIKLCKCMNLYIQK